MVVIEEEIDDPSTGYTETIIARTRRDFAWIMARSPTLASDDSARLARRVQEPGYDVARLQQVPQRW